jgi:hypothetical protein
VVHLGFGVFNDIIPAQIADLGRTNPPYAPTFVGGIGGPGGRLCHRARRSGSAADAAVAANASFSRSSKPGASSCAGFVSGAPTCPLAVSLNTFSTGTLKTPYYYQYNFGIEQKAERERRPPHRVMSARADFMSRSGRPERLPDRLRRMLCALPLRATRSTSDSAA